MSLVTDGSGAVVSEQKYTAWGVVRAVNGAMPTDIGYTGQRLDATGLMFYGARYYDASLSRFISADSIVPGAGNPQALNRYAYVLGNPLKYMDPTGHYCVGSREDVAECAFIEHQIAGSYGIDTNNAWDVEAINDFWKRLQEVSSAVGGDRIVKGIWGGTGVFLYKDGAEIAKYNACDDPSTARPCSKGSRINMPRDRLRSGDVAHELAHVWDFRTPTPMGLARIIDTNDTGQGGLWREMANETGGRYCYGFWICASGGSMSESWWALGTNDPGRASYARANPWEDWAMSFELYVTHADDQSRKQFYNDSQWAQRQSFIRQQIGLAWYRNGW